jgi:hypothetical protein
MKFMLLMLPTVPGTLEDRKAVPGALSGLRLRRVAPPRRALWHRGSHRALRRGRPVGAGQSRRRHGSGERPCTQR